jgi:hypothetical protein
MHFKLLSHTPICSDAAKYDADGATDHKLSLNALFSELSSDLAAIVCEAGKYIMKISEQNEKDILMETCK